FAPNEASSTASDSRSCDKGNSAGSFSRVARSLMQATSISCLLPTSAYSSRFETRARVAISSVLAAAKPLLVNAAKAASRIRARTSASSPLFFRSVDRTNLVLISLDFWYHSVPDFQSYWYHRVPNKGERHAATLLLREYRIRLHRMGDCRDSIHL